jgi:RNA polymerase sigma-70 factor (ECF subfamily)
MDAKTTAFEENRRLLEGLAYRMLGTLADAQDVVQDTYVKWTNADTDDVQDVRAWLVTVCSRLSLNAMKSARSRRETYTGTWLPEPFVEHSPLSPAEQSEIDDTVSVALLVALEKLTPAERAAFLLHEIFGYSFDEVAAILGKNEAACRKLASRARTAVRADKPRFAVSPQEHFQLLEAFFHAARAGELGRLKTLLAEGVELYSDGGGKVEAVSEVLRGVEEVSEFMVAVMNKRTGTSVRIQTSPRWFNGVPGLLVYEDGILATALSVSIDAGVIYGIYAIRNPDKLTPFPLTSA